MTIAEWINSPKDVIQEMARKMKEKFDRYWSEIHDIMGVATVLDPRYKMDFLEFNFLKLYGNDSDAHVQRIRDLCYELLAEYQLKKSKESNSSSSSLVGSGDIVGSDAYKDYDLYIASKKRARTSFVKSELDNYLEEEVLPRTSDFDILMWWKTNGIKYPTLQAIARDLLAMPISIVASESAFSSSGQILSLHRSRLHWTTLEAMMCTRSWLLSGDYKGVISTASTMLDEMGSDNESN
ncbi:hypothetical protein RIF29_38291 [Crotalaria pallida]|uniref:Uncharacterized protein n=1 Tax=Crotalaria pallida TaxID=3830 RepID=A0AAN9DZ10_CROPI